MERSPLEVWGWCRHMDFKAIYHFTPAEDLTVYFPSPIESLCPVSLRIKAIWITLSHVRLRRGVTWLTLPCFLFPLWCCFALCMSSLLALTTKGSNNQPNLRMSNLLTKSLLSAQSSCREETSHWGTRWTANIRFPLQMSSREMESPQHGMPNPYPKLLPTIQAKHASLSLPPHLPSLFTNTFTSTW